MTLPNIIAIDGPAASGKSTLAFHLARYLGYLYFDTGVMYRAVTWAALDRGVPIEDEAAVTRIAETVQIDVRPPSVDDERVNDVVVDGQDVTWEIRSKAVEKAVSPVATYRGVREAMASQQRRIGLRGDVVMVGRDIGTVVLPEAGWKIYLDASVEERARRRLLEKLSRGEQTTFDEVLLYVKMRDEIDSGRAVAPLRPADDAIILCSNGMNAEQVLEKVKSILAEPQ